MTTAGTGTSIAPALTTGRQLTTQEETARAHR
jgi:hypothetical protein